VLGWLRFIFFLLLTMNSLKRPFYQVLILIFLLECWLFSSYSPLFSSSLPSLSVTLCLVPVSMKPLLLESTMCSDWSAGAVCCDWCFGNVPPLTITSSFNTLLTNSTRPRPFILRMNYLNEEYCEKLKMEAFQKHWHWYREELPQTATLHTKES